MSPTPGLDPAAVERVEALLREHGDLAAGETMTADLISGGRSNLTYRLRTPRDDLVLRRPPLGHVLSTAHDMGREFRVISALHRTADVPVPRPVLFCADPGPIGAPFYVMRHVDGDVLRGARAPLALPPEQQASAAHHLVEVLGNLHRTDPDAVGLRDFGRPEGFMARQVARWTRQLADSRSRDLPGVEKLASGLAESVPAQAYSSVIHGDYRLDNCVVRGGRIAAVLDWEMATLGDPLADIGLFAVYYAGFADLENSVVHSLAGLGGYPSLDALLERYARQTGTSLAGLDWYVAFAWFKLAVILEGIHYRTTLGASVGDGFDGVAALVLPSIDRGLAALAG